MIVSSTRFKNSGLKVARSASVTRRIIVSSVLRAQLLDELAAHVAGHDHDGILEIHRAAVAVGHAPVVEDLQKYVEDIRVGLFDLVKEHHGVGPAAHRLGEVAPLVVAHVARRGADETRDGVFFHVLAHVDADHGLLGVEEKLGQGLGQFGLAHARGAHEDERADGPVGVLEPERARRTALATALMASAWPMTRRAR